MYKEQLNLFKSSYWKTFVVLFLLFVVSGVASYYVLLENPNLANQLMEQVFATFEEKDLFDPNMTAIGLAYKLFINNSTATLIIFLTGFIPLFLPAILVIGLNGAIVGVLFSTLTMNGESIFVYLMAGIVPHGIFEIPAIILSGSLAFYLSVGIFKKLSRPNEISFRKILLDTVKTFFLVCIPLLIIAALVEAFITPWILLQFI